MAEEIVITEDLIQKLVEVDPAFMYKLQNIKDKIIYNMDAYADKLGEMNPDFFTEEERDDIQKIKTRAMTALEKLEKKMGFSGFDGKDSKPADGIIDKMKPNIPISDKVSDKMKPDIPVSDKVSDKANAEGVFERDAQLVTIDGFSQTAQKQVNEILSSIGYKGTGEFSIDGGKGPSTSGILKKMGGSVMTALGLGKVPSVVSTLAKSAGAAAPIVLIAGGLIWAAIDGVRGFLKADEWGVSKIAGMMGGLLGGMNAGLMGGIKNMGKWALIGAGIGLTIGPVGILIGGLIGAAIGGILGWIGGEKIAKATDKIFAWVNEKFKAVLEFFGDLTEGFKDGFWEGIGYFFGRLHEKVTGFFITAGENLQEFFAGKSTSDILKGIWGGLQNIGIGIYEGVMDISTKITSFFKDLLSGIWKKIKGGFKKGKQAEIDAVIDGELDNTNKEKKIIAKTGAEVKLVLPEMPDNAKATEDQIKEGNKIALKNAEVQEQYMKDQQEYMEAQTEYLKMIAEKPSSAGSGPSSNPVDMGEIREAANDAAFNSRVAFFRQER